MNKKVIKVWVFIIIIFFAVGIIGYINNFSNPKSNINERYIHEFGDDLPKNSKVCKGSFDNYGVTYLFNFDEYNIKDIQIYYSGTNIDTDIYDSIVKIRSLSMEGFSARYTGNQNSFSMMISFEPAIIDKSVINGLGLHFRKASILVDNTNVYETYKRQIVANPSFICD